MYSWKFTGPASSALSRSAGAGGGLSGGGGGGGGVDSQREPLLLDFDFGVLTAHRLDGGVAFQTTLTTRSRGPNFEDLFGARRFAVCHYLDGSPVASLALVRRDGSRFLTSDVHFGFGAFLTPAGVVLRGAAKGTFIEGEVVHTLPLSPLAGVLPSGAVPAVDGALKVQWLDARTGVKLRDTAIDGVTMAGPGGERLFATSRDTLWESTLERDEALPSPFASPILLATNAARQALVGDPQESRLVVADFARGRVDDVVLEAPGLTAMGPHFDLGLALDDEGFVYATFAGRGKLHVLRTRDLGVTWEPLTQLPGAGVTLVRVVRHADAVLVAGGLGRGPGLVNWTAAQVVHLETGSTTELPLGQPQPNLTQVLPAELSADGKRAAWFESSDGGLTLRSFEEGTGMTTLETRVPAQQDPLGMLPRLEWLE
ncbi:MAG: hypothetical protein AB1938_13935 [Myxococcota bacterium]